MLNYFEEPISRIRQAWTRTRSPLGYTLFVVVVGYGFWKAPSEIWLLEARWMLAALAVIPAMFFLQLWQVRLFIAANGLNPGWLRPALLNAQKGTLNTVLPARSGTILFLHQLNYHYSIGWRDLFRFFVLAAGASLWVSILSVIWLIWPWQYSIACFLVSLALSVYLARDAGFRYAACLPELLLIALGLYLATVMAFYFLLLGLGYHLSFVEVSYFAIALNILAQISITPGNLGVREVLIGLVSPYVALPTAVGIIASTVLLVLRLTVYGAFWLLFEWLLRCEGRRGSALPEIET
ncbi:hypothetical protein [Thiorhodococcus minor]|uniref:Flippase-like domain-containing protein n=1 Tax=Thiorhodococcus minor TaxID=57489 RepID=A0A6M0K4X4_9GAMM|nr:hypothetical protein [Thiorhodococcus minor]NEV64836.1 hypothetical protein [Thiorhodococcus minor]